MQIITKFKLFFALLFCLLQSCFTGIESTPKITLNESNLEIENSISEEQKHLSNIKNEPFNQWDKGKQFIVTDNKISLIFNENSQIDTLSGETIIYQKYNTSTSVAGTSVTNLYFTHNCDTIIYIVNATPKEISKRKSFLIPFTVQQSLIDDVKNALLNNSYYIVTSLAYDSIGNSTNIPKFVPIKINDITAGNHIYPIKVSFTTKNNNSYWVYMTIGDDIQSTRNFETQFSLTNPKQKYPHISDNYWNAITNNIVIIGMTKEECRLAIGIPNHTEQLPSNAGIIEIWRYDNGYQLIFEDGLLKNFRH